MILILILWQLLIQLLLQFLILMATLTLLLKLMLKLTLLRLLMAHPLAVMEEEERSDSALSNSAPGDADAHSRTSSALPQFSHGRRDYGLAVLSPAERPDTPNIRWCSRR